MTRRWIVALAVVALVVYGSLYPWHFDFGRQPGNPLWVLLHSWPREWNRIVLRDAVANVLFYVPVGLTLFMALAQRCRVAMAFAAAALSAAFLSANMEMLQLYVPGRMCSLLELAANTAGGLAGALAGLTYRRKFPEPAGERPPRRHADALILLAAWAGYQLYPLFPLLSPTRFRAGMTYLLHSTIWPVEVWANAAEWFAVGLAMEAVDVDLPPVWLAIPMLCMPLRILIAGRTVSLDELLGGVLALFLLSAMRPSRRAKAGIWLLGLAILLHELAPFHFSAHATPFSWIPFRSSIEAERQAAVVAFLRKAFDYGAAVWLLRKRGIPYLYAGAGTAAALFACEWAQRYLPDRGPEITDALLAGLMSLMLWMADRRPKWHDAWTYRKQLRSR